MLLRRGCDRGSHERRASQKHGASQAPNKAWQLFQSRSCPQLYQHLNADLKVNVVYSQSKHRCLCEPSHVMPSRFRGGSLTWSPRRLQMTHLKAPKQTRTHTGQPLRIGISFLSGCVIMNISLPATHYHLSPIKNHYGFGAVCIMNLSTSIPISWDPLSLLQRALHSSAVSPRLLAA